MQHRLFENTKERYSEIITEHERYQRNKQQQVNEMLQDEERLQVQLQEQQQMKRDEKKRLRHAKGLELNRLLVVQEKKRRQQRFSKGDIESEMISLGESVRYLDAQIQALSDNHRQDRGTEGSTKALRETRHMFSRGGIPDDAATYKEWYQGYEVQHIIPFSIGIKLGIPLAFINGPMNLIMLPKGREDGTKRSISPARAEHAQRRPMHIVKGLNHPYYNKLVSQFISQNFPALFSPETSDEYKVQMAIKIAYVLRETAKKANKDNGAAYIDSISMGTLMEMHTAFIRYQSDDYPEFGDIVTDLSRHSVDNRQKYLVSI